MKKPDGATGWDFRIAMLTLTAVASLVGIVLATLRGPLAGTSDGQWPLTWLGWPVAGWMVLLRRPGNRIGRLSLAIGAVMGVAFFLQSIVLDVGPTAGAWIELTYTVLGIAPWLLIVAIINTFPTGSYAGKWEKFLGRALIVVALWAGLGFTFSGEPLIDTRLDNPLALPALSAVAVITNESGFFLVVILGLGALARMFVRAKRSTGMERQQFRWLLLGAAVFLIISGAGQFLPEDSSAELVWFLGGWAIPTSIGIAVIRYRLYEIDRIISRTVAYAVVVALLAGVFFGVVTLVSSFLPNESSDLTIAASTLAVAALFNPVRSRVQRFVDRRFNRSRYDAERVMNQFAGSLQGRVDSRGVVDGWVGVVSDTMQPSLVAVWVRE